MPFIWQLRIVPALFVMAIIVVPEAAGSRAELLAQRASVAASGEVLGLDMLPCTRLGGRGELTDVAKPASS